MNMVYLPLALFSDLISDRQKSQIATKLLEIEPKQPEFYQIGRPTEFDLPQTKRDGLKLELIDFIGEKGNFMFDVLNFDRSWLTLHSHDWNDSDSYKQTKRLDSLCTMSPSRVGVRGLPGRADKKNWFLGGRDDLQRK